MSISATSAAKLVKLGQLEDAMEAAKEYMDETFITDTQAIYRSATRPTNLKAGDLWLRVITD